MSKALAIKDFPGYYVTDTGDVYSRNYGACGRFKKLKQEHCKNGYKRVTLCVNGKAIRKLVHRLVAEAFILNPENKCDVNHKNGEVVAEFYGCVEAEARTGIHRTRIGDCCRGYKHCKTAGGYQWKYK